MIDFSVLVSGAGSIGRRHLQNLRSLCTRRLSTCDPSPASREAIARDADAVYETLEEAIAQEHPDIIFICSPSNQHIPQALLAARANAHLFIEKPLSHTLDGCTELQNETSKRGLKTMIGCNMRFHHGPATIKKLLSDGVIGKPKSATIYTGSYLPHWRPQQDYHTSYSADPVQGGAILDCIHEIDLALWYNGPATLQRAVVEPALSIGLTVEGAADVILRHENGVESTVHLSFTEPEYRRFCMIIGEHGELRWNIHTKKVDVLDLSGTLIAEHPEPLGYNINQMYIDEIVHFLDCVAHDRTPSGFFDEALRVLQIALEAKVVGKMGGKVNS